MYGPVLNVQRGKLPEAVDTKTENSFLSTHSDGSRSGLPLWGSWRTFSARSLPHRKEMREGRISPVMRDDLTASTLEQTSAPAESPAEQDGLGYIELLSFLPCMQDRAVLVSGGPLEGQMWETENILTQEMQRDPEKQNTLALTSYGVVLHEYHDDLKRAASILEQAVMGEPTCVEALNAYGAVLFELAQRANRDPRAVSVRDLIFDRSIQWGDRRSQKPNCYEALTKLQHKLKPVSMKGCIEVGKRLHRLEAIVAAQDLAAAGLEKFGGGTPVSAPPTSPLRAKISSSKAADSALQPEASPITAARSRRHPANWNLESPDTVAKAAMMSQISDFEKNLQQFI